MRKNSQPFLSIIEVFAKNKNGKMTKWEKILTHKKKERKEKKKTRQK